MSRLQEKLAEIRTKIPALQKKKNSDSVDYEFCNIDDVYKFLTPALNEMKVNFDVVKCQQTGRERERRLLYMDAGRQHVPKIKMAFNMSFLFLAI